MDSPANPLVPSTPAPVLTPEPALSTTAVTPVAAILSRRRTFLKFAGYCVAAILTMYLISAYLIVPAAWRQFTSHHPALDGMPKYTTTGDGIPGDPLNVAVIGHEAEVTTLMLSAGWHPADPITLRSCLRISKSTVFKNPYEKAPVSNLYLWGRKQDLAFQFPLKDASQRHHVRFWKSEDVDDEGRPLWIGAATFDLKVGISHTTGQITHHIAHDIDTERDKLFKDLESTGLLEQVTWMEDFHEKLEGRNGGGDVYKTDGQLVIGRIRVLSREE